MYADISDRSINNCKKVDRENTCRVRACGKMMMMMTSFAPEVTTVFSQSESVSQRPKHFLGVGDGRFLAGLGLGLVAGYPTTVDRVRT